MSKDKKLSGFEAVCLFILVDLRQIGCFVQSVRKSMRDRPLPEDLRNGLLCILETLAFLVDTVFDLEAMARLEEVLTAEEKAEERRRG